MPVKPPPTRKRIDWSELIFDLERAGYSQRQIGVECGFEDHVDLGGSWVNKLKNLPGTQPKFHNGALLLGLWAEVMAKQPSEAPSEA